MDIKIFSFITAFLGFFSHAGYCSYEGFSCDEVIKCPHYRDRQGATIDTLVLHYTAGDLNRAKYHFSGESGSKVSAHFMIDSEGKSYFMVSPEKSAFHAGVSFWNGIENINNNSIGIENVNFGYFREGLYDRYSRKMIDSIQWQKRGAHFWSPFSSDQITRLINLSGYIINKYKIQPRNVVGHSDVAPSRKQDPGGMFPWETLAKAGIGAWPNENIALRKVRECPQRSVSYIQEMLRKYGYSVPQNGMIDSKTQNVIKAFQMHFDSSTVHFGKIDKSLVHKLAYLVDQYCS